MKAILGVAAFAASILGVDTHTAAAAVCGDVNKTNSVTSTDALLVLRTAVGAPAVLQCGAPGELARTGQVGCYDTIGMVVPCTGTGQDGDLQKGLARSFADNGDGTITDNNTGLMWEKLDNSNVSGLGGIHDIDRKYSWVEAFAKATTLNAMSFAGYNDWRLPNAKELYSLTDLGVEPVGPYDETFDNACVPGCTVITCSCAGESDWSSSTYVFSPDRAWALDVSWGPWFGYYKANRTHAARVVRDGASGIANSDAVCGDVNGSDDVTSSDALFVLRAAVGVPLDLQCDPSGLLARSGQTVCYGVDGTIIVCGDTGHDGDLQKGLLRSNTDNGDGTISDHNTGLMWEKLDDSNLPGAAGIHDFSRVYSWAAAFAKVADLNASSFAGYSDWRLPNVTELYSLSNLGIGDPAPAVDAVFHAGCVPGCTASSCSCSKAYDCWTSTTFRSHPDQAWTVSGGQSYTNWVEKTSALCVRAVRSGS